MHIPSSDNRFAPPAPAPGLSAAVGLMATYFLLQAVIGSLLVLAIGVATRSHAVTQGIAAAPSLLAQPATQAVLAILTLAVSAPLTLLLARWRWPRLWSIGRPPGLGFVAPARPVFLLLALVAGLAAPLLGGVLTQWLADSQPVVQDIRQLGGNTPFGLRLPLVLMVVAVGPLVEELLFRGVLMSALLRRCRVGWAVAITSLLFALVHLPGLQFHWYALPALGLLAVTLAWLRLHSGSIWPAILAHATNNLLAVAVWFVVPSLTG